MLAAVITGKSPKEIMENAKKSNGADVIELRLDYIKNLKPNKLKKIIKISEKPVIATDRKRSEGGFFKGSEAERIEMLKNAANYGAEYVDIELSSGDVVKDLIKNKKNSKIIVSYHNFRETPDDINLVYKNINNLTPDFIKIATYANSVSDNFKVFDLIKSAEREKANVIAFCMGSYGEFSRILCMILGSKMTYASLDRKNKSASGQLPFHEMNNIYKIKKLSRKTKIAGLIGNPVEHSWSHIIHNAAFEKLGIDAVYLKFRVDKLKEFIDYFKKMSVIGFSVTIPHKIDVISHLDKIDETAKAIGAVNTIVAKNNKLIGYNTDCEGAMLALKKNAKIRGKNVVIIGAGGSSRALAYGLKKENADTTILNRTIKNAKIIADDFGCGYGSLSDLKGLDYDILINTTPVGMHPNFDKSPVNPKCIKENSVVFDIVYNPFKTELLKIAEKKDCTIINGFEMLVNGAALQFGLWTGKEAPEYLMRKKVLDYLKNAGHKN